MSVEQRRAMIVAAAVPLIAEHGAAVTTSQVARAAGIGEATIFRAFKDKDELLDACVLEVTGPDHVLRELASIPLDDPLPARLVQAAEALHAYLERMGAVLGSLFASGRRRSRPMDEQAAPGAREASVQALREGLAELLEPDAAVLRVAPEKLAALFLGMLFMRPRDERGEAELDTAELIDVLLYGATAPAGDGAAAPEGAA
jgi:AcrR family transcriptional regulator